MADMKQENWKTTEKETNDSLKKEELEEKDASEKKENSDKQLKIDIKNLIIKNQGLPSSHLCCIYRAQLLLLDVDTAAFTPKIVSIGPLHHSQDQYKGMEETKIKYLEQFLQHAANTARLHKQHQLDSIEENMAFLVSKGTDIERSNDFPGLDEFLSLLQSRENDIRSSYAENLSDFKREEFLKLVLVDAAFIIELFLRFHFQRYDDTMLPPAYMFALIRTDLWLLENQLPFFILEKLYDLAFGCHRIYPPFLELTFKFFGFYNEQKLTPNDVKREARHFTDLLRTFFLPSSVNFEEEKGDPNENEIVLLLENLPSATQLHNAGVKFIATESNCLFDIKFSKSNGTLEIPTLRLSYETAVRFRNLIALEQNLYPHESFVSDYFVLMDYLIDTCEDADLLVEKKIITRHLGSNNEVTVLYNSLCKNILKGVINQSFGKVISELNEYYGQRWHRWKATLRKQYFSTPWRGASTIAAIILLALTLAQTILAVLAL